MNEQHRTEREPDNDRLGQVAEYCESKRCEEDSGIAARGAQQGRDRVLLDHVPGNHGKHAGQARQRNVGGQRRRDEDENKQERRMQYSRDRTVRPGPNVRGRPRNRTGNADAADKRRTNVGDIPCACNVAATGTMNAPAGPPI